MLAEMELHYFHRENAARHTLHTLGGFRSFIRKPHSSPSKLNSAACVMIGAARQRNIFT